MVSSRDAKTRRNDYEKKVPIYERAGIPEYLIVDPPTRFTQDRLLLTGYRLGEDGRYRRIEPDVVALSSPRPRASSSASRRTAGPSW